MKRFFLKNISVIWAVLMVGFFEIFSYLLSGKNIWGFSYSDSYALYFVLANVAIFLLLPLYLVVSDTFQKNSILKFIPLALLDISLFVFSIFSSMPSLFIIGQVLFFLSFVVFAFLGSNIENENKKYVFVNFSSFFIAFFCFFTSYMAFYNFSLPYWIIIAVMLIFSVLLMDYKFIHINISKDYRRVLLVIFSIIITEFFLFSFFWPIDSIMVKSILLSLVYYFYWGMIDSYVKKSLRKETILLYIITFVLLSVLSLVSLLIKIK